MQLVTGLGPINDATLEKLAAAQRLAALSSPARVIDLDAHFAPEAIAPASLVFWSNDAGAPLVEAWASRRLHHLLHPDIPVVELAAVLERVDQPVPLGPTGLLGPAVFRHRWAVQDSAQKATLLDELGRRAQVAGLNRRGATRLLCAAEELVTNALYNAPTDASGKPLYAHQPRSARVELPPGKVRVELAADEERVALVVADTFGSLTEAVAFSNLARCFRADHDQVAAKAGGAGLGLFTVLGAANHLAIVVLPELTEVTVIIDKRSARPAGKTFNWFGKSP